MSLATVLAGLTPEQKVACLERVKDRLIAWHNVRAQELSAAEFAAWQRDTFRPKMDKAMNALATARAALASVSDYDARIGDVGVL